MQWCQIFTFYGFLPASATKHLRLPNTNHPNRGETPRAFCLHTFFTWKNRECRFFKQLHQLQEDIKFKNAKSHQKMQQRCERKMCKRGDGIPPQVLVLTRKSQMNPFFWKHVTHNLNWGDNQSAHIKQMKSSCRGNHLKHCRLTMKANIIPTSMLPHLPIFKNLSQLFYCDLYPW